AGLRRPDADPMAPLDFKEARITRWRRRRLQVGGWRVSRPPRAQVSESLELAGVIHDLADGREPVATGFDARDAGKEASGVGMQRASEERGDGRVFDDAPGVHHADN